MLDIVTTDQIIHGPILKRLLMIIKIMIITEDRNSTVKDTERGEMVQREKMSKREGNMKVDFMYTWV